MVRSTSKSKSEARGGAKPLPQMQPLPWSDHRPASDYLSHILCEVGRLGFVEEWQNSSRDDWRVLDELLRWRDELPSKAIGEIGDWLHLDLEPLSERARLSRDPDHSKPRIELTAEVTSKDNLTVRWFPAGYRGSTFSFQDIDGYFGDLRNRSFLQRPDFRYFVAGEIQPARRPNHELMFIRGVGHLRPEFKNYGPYVKFNMEVLHALLICATRASFNQLVMGLREAFDVVLLNNFEFELDAVSVSTPSGGSYAQSHVRKWRLVPAATTGSDVR